MLRSIGLVGRRALATAAMGPAASPTVPPPGVPASLGAKKLYETPSFRTQKEPVYRLPYYGAAHEEIAALSDAEVNRALRVYGGLMRKYDEPEVLRQRLQAAVRADYRPKQLTIAGVVVSDKMDKSVVVAARRQAYERKLRLKYFKTRRFMAHDELNLCREGDQVVIRSCRPLSKRKTHVVVENFGDRTRVGEDTRCIDLDALDDSPVESEMDEEGEVVDKDESMADGDAAVEFASNKQ